MIERYNYNDEPSGRSETLVQALERCERLETQLEIAKENKKLKDLLKEIRGKIHYINIPKNRHNIFDKYFVDKIDEALQ